MSTWRINGDVLIACNCDWGCPCNFNARPSRGFCQGGWIWLIESGRVDDVDLVGLGVAVFAKWPGAIHEGGGRATCYIDDRADAQRSAVLTRIVRGELGGPWGLFIKTYDSLRPWPLDSTFTSRSTRRAPRSATSWNWSCRRSATRSRRRRFIPRSSSPKGSSSSAGGLAASTVFRVRDELGLDHSGQYAAFGRFDYS